MSNFPMGFFGRIRDSLSRTKQQIVERFDDIVRRADAPERRSRAGRRRDDRGARRAADLAPTSAWRATDRIIAAVKSRGARTARACAISSSSEIRASLPGRRSPDRRRRIAAR